MMFLPVPLPWVIIVGTLFHLLNALVLLFPGFLNCVALYALFIKFHPLGRPATPPS